MLANISSAGLAGIDGFAVSVQVDASFGLPRAILVGNASQSVREALDRADIALKNAGFPLPPRRITVNLQPAEIRKEGSGFDLAITAGILRAVEFVPDFPLEGYAFLGELGLDGQVRHVNGILSLMKALKQEGFRGAVVPLEDVQEALAAGDLDILGIPDLKALLQLLASQKAFRQYQRPVGNAVKPETHYSVDFSEVIGQQYAVRAALIAAAGGHNLLLSGPAGSGKTMIARRIPTILPPLTREESIEITRVYSVRGMLPKGQALISHRPFRMPHHSITVPALTGGSQGASVLPGELALATGGVLFLDELPLFSRAAIEALRQPMEDRRVILNRLNGVYVYPADCLIAAAMNPCPCGFFPDRNRCHCTEGQVRSYQRGISRPILERMDLCAEVSPVDFPDAAQKSRTSSETLRGQVLHARLQQARRFAGLPHIRTNAGMGGTELERFCHLASGEQAFMKQVFRLKGLSMRSYHRVLRVSRTIADLEDSREIRTVHLAEALSYRGLEERLFGAEPEAQEMAEYAKEEHTVKENSVAEKTAVENTVTEGSPQRMFGSPQLLFGKELP